MTISMYKDTGKPITLTPVYSFTDDEFNIIILCVSAEDPDWFKERSIDHQMVVDKLEDVRDEN